MAAANENQGLKIAVAAFVTLTVVLAVTTYFAYSSYSEASTKLDAAQNEKRQADQVSQTLQRNLDELRRIAGYEKIEDFEAVKAAVQKDQQTLEQQLTLMTQKVGQMLQQYRAAGGDAQKVESLANATNQTAGQITGDPNRTFQSTQQRMTELVDNMTQLSTALVLDNEDLRKSLNSVNQVNAEQLQVQLDAVRKANQDLEAEHATHEQERSKLVQQVGDFQTLTAQQQNKITELETQIARMTDENQRQRTELLAQLRGWREQVEKNEEIMDVPDGRITFVDYGRGEVRTTLGRRQGARERMQFSVFDRSSPGLPTDRPKGVIELIRVNDTDSLARIVKTSSYSDPIRDNDFVYSAAWSADRPNRFALIGKIDIDRDGRDDRDDLKRLIRQAGGAIDYDLPPPGVGPETGKMTGLTTFYVLDDREPLRPPTGRAGEFPGTETSEWLQKKSEVLEQAQLSGVRPIAVDRLLAYLGYSYGQAVPGRVEAINRGASDALLNPGNRPTPPPPGSEKDVEIMTTPPPGGGF